MNSCPFPNCSQNSFACAAPPRLLPHNHARYDNNGNTLTKAASGGTTVYAWDYENRLSSVTLPGSGGTVSFKYDPFGRRIYKSSSSGTSVFSYDGPNLVEETNATGAVAARYAGTANVDEPLAMLRSGSTSLYNTDGLGSITSLTNSSGAIAATYTFDSFGNQTASTGSLTNPFRYTARELDPETNLYFYRARYYDSSTGRFISEDPTGFAAASNFYAYVGNDPAAFSDPAGKDAQDVTKIVSTSADWLRALVISGLRLDGTGRKAANLNNIAASAQYANLLLSRPPIPARLPFFGCGQQTDYVLYGLTNLLNKLHDNWKFDKEEGFLNWPWDPFYHQRIRAISANKSDPDIIVDPWLNEFQTVPKGADPNPKNWSPLK